MRSGRRLAFITGINRYGNNIPPLSSAVADAEAVGRVLRDLHGYEVELHLDEQATLAGLRALFEGLAARLGEDDWVVIYFAGHGVSESGEADGPAGYFLPVDADRDRVESFLPMSEVQRALDRIASKHLLVLLDCCFAGAFKWSKTRAVMGRPKKLYKERYERYLREPARQVLTSSASNQTALDVVSGKVVGVRDVGAEHSPFALALVRALRDAVADVGFDGGKGDGVTTVSELHLYVESVMAKAEQGLGRAVQKPMLWQLDDRSQGEFLFEAPGHQAVLPSALTLSAENNPYRGPAAYEEQHGPMFFGRAELTAELVTAVEARPLTVVLGPSGCGRSSLVKAGLAYALKRSARRWLVLTPLAPGPSPMGALGAAAAELWAASGDAPGRPGVTPPSLPSAIKQFKIKQPDIEVLLIVDPLDDLSAPGLAEQRAAFVPALREAMAAGLRVVATLRSDRASAFAELGAEDPAVAFAVRPMSRAELRDVVTGPAAERVLDFEPPALVDALVDGLVDRPGTLALLSQVLSELYLARLKRDATDRALTGADLERLGGVSGVLFAQADRVYDGQPDGPSREVLGALLLRLVSIKGGDASARRTTLDELSFDDAAVNARAQTILEQLLSARVAVVDRDTQRPATVEAAHERLVLGWRRTREVLEAHQDSLPIVRACTTAAEEWRGSGELSPLLWSGDPRLPLLEVFSKLEPTLLNAAESRFVKASGARKRRQTLILTSVVISVIAVLAVSTVVALISRSNAIAASERARYSRLIAEAGRPFKDITLEQSLLLAVEASRRRESVETDTILRAVQNQPANTEHILVDRPGATVHGLAWLREGGRSLVVEGGEGETLGLWDGATGDRLDQVTVDPGGLSHAVDEVRASPGRDRVMVHTGWWRGWAVYRVKQDRLDRVDTGAMSERIRRVSWSGDGQAALLVAARSWMIWRQGEPPNELPAGAEIGLADGVILADGQVLLCGSRGPTGVGYAALFSPGAPAPVAEIVTDGAAVERCAASPDGRWLAFAMGEGVRLVRRGVEGSRTVHVGQVNALAFDKDGQYLAAGMQTGRAGIWNVSEEKDMCILDGHTAGVLTAVYGASGDQLLTSSADGTAILWDANNCTRQAVLSGHDGPLRDARFDPDDPSRFATSSEDGTARIFKVGQAFPVVFGGEHHEIRSVAAAPDGRVVLLEQGGVVTIRSIEPGPDPAALRLGGGFDAVATMALCPGDRLITTNAADQLQVWDTTTAKLVRTIEGPVSRGSTPSCSHDGGMVAAPTDGGVTVWDTRSGAVVHTASLFLPARAVIWHPSQERLAAWIWSSFQQIWLIDPTQGAPPRGLTGNVDGVWSAVWSHDGAWLVSGDNGTPGGANGRIHVYAASGAEAPVDLAQEGNDKTFALAFSPDDDALLTGGQDAARVWDSSDADPSRWTVRWRLAAREVQQVAWSPAGDRALTIDTHGALRLFDPATGALVSRPTFPGGVVQRAAFTSTGAAVLVLLSDGTAQLLPVYQSELRRELCGRAVRRLTPEEWERFVAGEDYRDTCGELMDPG